MKKLTIWTSETYLDDDAREEYQQYQREVLEDEEYCITDREDFGHCSIQTRHIGIIKHKRLPTSLQCRESYGY